MIKHISIFINATNNFLIEIQEHRIFAYLLRCNSPLRLQKSTNIISNEFILLNENGEMNAATEMNSTNVEETEHQ